jgi:hypothetical protein
MIFNLRLLYCGATVRELHPACPVLKPIFEFQRSDSTKAQVIIF